MITFIFLDLARGSGEAKILLSNCECEPWEEDCPAKDCDGYEIVIGAHNNTKSVIREHKQQPDSPDYYIDVSKSINYQEIFYHLCFQTPNILSSTEWTSFRIYVKINARDLTLTIEVQHEDYVPFLNRTWKIESIPYKFILPKDAALSTSNGGSLDVCLTSLSEICNRTIAFAPPHPVESPGLRVCSREDPCQLYEGDCGSVGDESCADDLGTNSIV